MRNALRRASSRHSRATACVYFEEGVMTPSSFEDIAAMGFALGDFEGNVVPVSKDALSRLGDHFR